MNPQGGQGAASTVVKPLGDLGTGVHSVNVSFPRIQVGPTDQVIVNYLVVNSGHTDPTKVETNLKSAGDGMSTIGKVVYDLTHLNTAGLVVAGMGAIASLISDVFNAIFGDANCDGPVAAQQSVLAYSDLPSSPGTPVVRSTTHPGNDSPHGCGKNSVYEVTWKVSQDPQQVLGKL